MNSTRFDFNKRSVCSKIIDLSETETCDLLYKIAFEDEEYIRKMFKRYILLELVKMNKDKETYNTCEDVSNNIKSIISKIMDMNFYIQLKFKKRSKTKRYDTFIWFFGDEYLYLATKSDLPNDIYMLQCAYRLLFPDGSEDDDRKRLFTNFDLPVHGFKVTFSHFNYNQYLNSIFDRFYVTKIVVKIIKEFITYFEPLTSLCQIDNSNYINSFAKSIDTIPELNSEQKKELADIWIST